MKNIIIIALALVTLVACASKKKVATTTETKATTPKYQVLSLSKTACYGSCPVFTLKVYSNGLAVLNGKQNVKHVGLSELMLTDAEMKTMMQTCTDADLFGLEDSYEKRVMDVPTTTLTYTHDGKTKKIVGNMGFPAGFKAVVKECMDLLDDERWELKKAYNTK